MRTKKKAPSAHPNQGRRWGLKRVSNVDAFRQNRHLPAAVAASSNRLHPHNGTSRQWRLVVRFPLDNLIIRRTAPVKARPVRRLGGLRTIAAQSCGLDGGRAVDYSLQRGKHTLGWLIINVRYMVCRRLAICRLSAARKSGISNCTAFPSTGDIRGLGP